MFPETERSRPGLWSAARPEGDPKREFMRVMRANVHALGGLICATWLAHASASACTTAQCVIGAFANRPPTGIVEIELAEGMIFTFPEQISVHRANLKLWSSGLGATLVNGGGGRIFDVALGGKLYLERIHLREGSGVEAGGCVQVRQGATLSMQDASMRDCAAASATGDARGGAIASWEPHSLPLLGSKSMARDQLSGVTHLLPMPHGNLAGAILVASSTIAFVLEDLATPLTMNNSHGASPILGAAISADGSLTTVSQNGDIRLWSTSSLSASKSTAQVRRRARSAR